MATSSVSTRQTIFRIIMIMMVSRGLVDSSRVSQNSHLPINWCACLMHEQAAACLPACVPASLSCTPIFSSFPARVTLCAPPPLLHVIVTSFFPDPRSAEKESRPVWSVFNVKCALVSTKVFPLLPRQAMLSMRDPCPGYCRAILPPVHEAEPHQQSGPVFVPACTPMCVCVYVSTDRVGSRDPANRKRVNRESGRCLW